MDELEVLARRASAEDRVLGLDMRECSEYLPQSLLVCSPVSRVGSLGDISESRLRYLK